MVGAVTQVELNNFLEVTSVDDEVGKTEDKD
jgi:hypothetical protein